MVPTSLITGPYKKRVVYSLGLEVADPETSLDIQQTLDVDKVIDREGIDIIDINHDGCPDIITLACCFRYPREQMLEIFLNTCACYTR